MGEFTTRFVLRLEVNGLNDYLETNWEQLLSYNANWLVRNGFPVDIFFSTMTMEGVPVLVNLSRAVDRPVLLLALSRAVSPLLAPATELDRGAGDLVAEGTMHEKSPPDRERVRSSRKVNGIGQVYTFGLLGGKLVTELISTEAGGD